MYTNTTQILLLLQRQVLPLCSPLTRLCSSLGQLLPLPPHQHGQLRPSGDKSSPGQEWQVCRFTVTDLTLTVRQELPGNQLREKGLAALLRPSSPLCCVCVPNSFSAKTQGCQRSFLHILLLLVHLLKSLI